MGKHHPAFADSNSFAISGANIDLFAGPVGRDHTLGVAGIYLRISGRKRERVTESLGRVWRCGCPAWIRTMNNASKGRCVTVTPQGNAIADFSIGNGSALDCARNSLAGFGKMNIAKSLARA